MADRRDFLRAVAGTALGVVAWPAACRGAAPARPGRLDAIGLQLWTVRHALEEDFEGTLARVAEVGYTEVELAGHFGHTAAEVRDILDRTGLRAPSSHVDIRRLREERPRVLEEAATLGLRWVVVPSIPARERTPAGYRAAAELLGRAGAEAREAGLRLAYHNHAFEFEPVDGRPAYDLLLAETEPEVVEFELDLYWITRAGHDPLAYVRDHPGRFPLLHVKDSSGPPQHRMVDPGAGAIDFPAIFAERERGGFRHYFVEHDEPEDPFATVRAGYEYMAGLAS